MNDLGMSFNSVMSPAVKGVILGAGPDLQSQRTCRRNQENE